MINVFSFFFLFSFFFTNWIYRKKKHVVQTFSRRSAVLFQVQMWKILIDFKPEISIKFNGTYIMV